MVSFNNGSTTEGTPKVQEQPAKTTRHFVASGDDVKRVIQWDKDGDELIFESDKGKFLALSESDVAGLSRDNRTRYFVSRALNEKHDPENDKLQQSIKVGEMRSRREEFEKVVRTTDQGSVATKKLQAFVGEGFSPFWSRTDKIEQRLADGYEIVKSDNTDVYAGTRAVDGHYETRVKQGETELVLMRIRNEDKAKIMKRKQEKADRQVQASERRGKAEILAQGGTPVGEDDKRAWQDRA